MIIILITVMMMIIFIIASHISTTHLEQTDISQSSCLLLSICFLFVFYLLTNFEHCFLHFAFCHADCLHLEFVQHFVHQHPANLVQHCAAKPSPLCHLDLLQHEHLEDHQEQRQRLGSLEQKTGKEIDLQFVYNNHMSIFSGER